MHPRGWRVVEYWLAVMGFIGALWLRVYIHALGQWGMLYALGVPVFSFQVSERCVGCFAHLDGISTVWMILRPILSLLLPLGVFEAAEMDDEGGHT